ncbi:MAG: stage III sporulation protein AF [Oscillospiraceae bacterium]|nr:stage III sporulation protein AF [Oscillospiraceae bacterium]
MDTLRLWASALCMAAVGAAILTMLAPKNSMGKLFRVLAAAFFLCCLLSPLLSMKQLTQLNLTAMPSSLQPSALSDTVKAQLNQQVSAAIEGVVTKALQAQNITPKKITADMDIDDQGGIYIKQVTVQVDKRDLAASALLQPTLAQQLGVTVTVVTE